MRRLTWFAVTMLLSCGRTEVVDFTFSDPRLSDGGADDGGFSLDGGRRDGGTSDGGELADGGTRPDAGTPDGGGEIDAGPPCPIDWNETVAATISITADDTRRVWVNGLHGESTTNQWTQPTRFSTRFFRHPQRQNVVAVYVTNAQNQHDLDRGLLADIRVGNELVVTDARWKQRGGLDGGWDINDPSWVAPGFDDSQWGTSAEVAANGSAPWGLISLVSTSAMWLWPYESLGSNKPVFEPVFFRRTLYVDMSGQLVDAPAACP